MSSIKHRHLSRKSSHRSALLRNLVTSLIETESIRTTWPRAKEAQRMVEKLITLGKRNTNAARQKAQGILFRPHEFLPKLFGPLRERYAHRPGGYTRVLRTEPLNRDRKHKLHEPEYNPGQPESAILELVDGPRDMRFAITARALVKQREREGAASGAGTGSGMTEILAANVRKVTRFREGGEEQLEREVRRLEGRGEGRRWGRGTEGREEQRQQEEEEKEEREKEKEEEEEEKEDVVERTAQGNDLMRRRPRRPRR